MEQIINYRDIPIDKRANVVTALAFFEQKNYNVPCGGVLWIF